MTAKRINMTVIVLAGLLLAAMVSCAQAESPNNMTTTATAATLPATTAPEDTTVTTPTTMPTTTPADSPAAIKTQKDAESYSLGVEMARSYQQQQFDVDMNLVIQGMKDASAGDKLLLSNADIQKAIMSLMDKTRETQMRAKLATAENNKKAGEAFLAANKAKPGVVTLPSGLQYKVLVDGTGQKPTRTSTVTVNYTGTLIDGTVFDSTRKAGRPATFNLSNGLIEGWMEALVQMPAGSKWQLFIPSQLAYGTRGAGQVIGPNATLIFEVELISVK